MKKSTIKTDVPFAQTKKEIVAFINSFYADLPVVKESNLRTAKEALLVFKDYQIEITGADLSILNAKWLNDRFTISQLQAAGIYTEGKLHTIKSDSIYVLGDAILTQYCFENENINIKLFENAEAEIHATSNCHVDIEAYGNSKVQIEASDFATVNLYMAYGSSQANTISCDQSRVNMQQYDNTKTSIELYDMANVNCYSSDHAKIELVTAAAPTRCIFKLSENAEIILNSKSSEIFLDCKKGHKGNVFIGNNSKPVKYVQLTRLPYIN